MTLVVLALDAADAALVDYFDLESFHLRSHTEMETYAHMQESPYTPEVWATIATGLGPEEHGVTDAGISQWDNPIVDFASRFTGSMPLPWRKRLGVIANEVTGAEYSVGETDASTFLDGEGRVVHNWPGVANGEELADVWRIMAVKEEKTRREFEREIRGIGVQQFAWADEMLSHDVALAAVHIHTLDALGHVYADDPDRLRSAYEWAGDWIERIESKLGEDDELLVVSDHGMTVSFYSDEGDRDQDVAGHSWRAYASSTAETVPESVYDVREWVESRVGEYDDDSDSVEIPEDQLRQLGYIE